MREEHLLDLYTSTLSRLRRRGRMICVPAGPIMRVDLRKDGCTTSFW